MTRIQARIRKGELPEVDWTDPYDCPQEETYPQEGCYEVDYCGETLIFAEEGYYEVDLNLDSQEVSDQEESCPETVRSQREPQTCLCGYSECSFRWATTG